LSENDDTAFGVGGEFLLKLQSVSGRDGRFCDATKFLTAFDMWHGARSITSTIIAKLSIWKPLPSCSDISYSLGGRTASLPMDVIEAGAPTPSVTSMASILRLAFQIILLCLIVILESAPVFAAGAVPRAPAESAIGDYRLGAGDKIRVTVFGENDLGGEFVIDGSGYVKLPLIGEVKATGLSARNFETEVETQLKDRFLLLGGEAARKIGLEFADQ